MQKGTSVKFSELSIEALSVIFSYMDVAFFEMLYSKEVLFDGREKKLDNYYEINIGFAW